MQLITCGKKRGGAILASQVELKRLEPGKGVGSVTVGASLRLAPLRHLGLGQIQGSRGPLVGGVQALFAFFLHGNRGFQAGELPLSLCRACPALFEGLLEAADLGLSSLDPAGPRTHLASQFRQTLTAIGGRTKETGETSGLGGMGDLDLRAMGDRGVERVLGLRALRNQRLLLLTESGGLRPQLFGIAGTVVRAVVLIVREKPDPFGGQRPGRHETFAQRREGEPAFLRASHQRRCLLRL